MNGERSSWSSTRYTTPRILKNTLQIKTTRLATRFSTWIESLRSPLCPILPAKLHVIKEFSESLTLIYLTNMLLRWNILSSNILKSFKCAMIIIIHFIVRNELAAWNPNFSNTKCIFLMEVIIQIKNWGSRNQFVIEIGTQYEKSTPIFITQPRWLAKPY